MTIINKQLAILDIGSVLAMVAWLAYADSPWWLYVATLCFGIAQKYVASKK